MEGRMRRVAIGIVLALLAVGVLGAAPVLVGNDLEDVLAPGVIGDGGDFGTSSVVVPQNGYVTYFVQGAANLAGTPVEIWITTGGNSTKATTRSFAADGSLRYYARVNGKTTFQARIPGTPGGAAHGRTASTWPSATDHRTKITV